MVVQHRSWVVTVLGMAVTLLAISEHQAQGFSAGSRREQCPLGDEVEDAEGRRLVVVLVVGGLGASAARTSCLSHQANPLFLNTQHDADLIHRLLKDCVKSRKLGSMWVPARRNAQLKRIERPSAESRVTSTGNVEYDWLSAHYNRSSDGISLLPFPKALAERKGVICIRKKQEE